ncbi:MAG TPA: DUF2269 family protein [Terriglobales bacterium]|nr:DUF2269 family protein [Terriglobales bacterium]
MNLATWLKFAHILGAIIWIGGGVMLSLIGVRARQSEDPHFIGEFSRILSYVGLRVLMPAVIAVLVFGIWLMLISPAWRLTQLWILLALAAFALAFLIGAVYLSRIALALDKLTADTDFDLKEARALLSRWIVGYQIVLLILLLAVWDMVFKPGL